MKLHFYNSSNDKREINKYLIPVYPTTVTSGVANMYEGFYVLDRTTVLNDSYIEGTINTEISITDPIIELELVDSSTKDLITINANYCYINEYYRYYYINKIEQLNKNTIRIHLHVDVLTSFYYLYNTWEVVLSRSETNYDWYMHDDMVELTGQEVVYLDEFPFKPFDTTPGTDNKGKYIITTLCSSTS